MSIAGIVPTSLTTVPTTSSADPKATTADHAAAGSTGSSTDGSVTTSSAHDSDAVKVTLSQAATAALDPNKKINSDGTIGPHHKPRHPKAHNSLHV